MTSNDAASRTRPASRRRFLSALAGGAVGVTTGAAWSPRASVSASGPTAVDIGFCTDMTVHHLQALVMCERVLGRDTGDPVQAAATEVLRNQAIEVGTMRAWLADWGEPTTDPEVVMAWMGMNDGAGVPIDQMTGYATDEQLRELSLATGLDQGRLWLQLMRAHHVGGVHMAEAALELASLDQVLRLARIQAEVQTFEIDQYDQLLATTYA